MSPYRIPEPPVRAYTYNNPETKFNLVVLGVGGGYTGWHGNPLPYPSQPIWDSESYRSSLLYISSPAGETLPPHQNEPPLFNVLCYNVLHPIKDGRYVLDQDW
jgi:hypothetical protein